MRARVQLVTEREGLGQLAMGEQENGGTVMQSKTDSEDLKMMQLLNRFTPPFSKPACKIKFSP